MTTAFGIIPGLEREVEIDGARFKIISLTARQLAPLSDAFLALGENRSIAGITALHADVVAAGLRGWDGFNFPDGSAVPFEAGKDGRPTDATIDRLPGDLLAKVSAAVMQANVLKDDDLGN